MASSDAFKAQQQKGTVMRTPLILAGATLLLSACGDKNEAAEEKLERAAETSATVAGPVPAALGLSEAQLLDAEKIGRAPVRTPVTNANLVCRLLLQTKNKIKNNNKTIHANTPN